MHRRCPHNLRTNHQRTTNTRKTNLFQLESKRVVAVVEIFRSNFSYIFSQNWLKIETASTARMYAAGILWSKRRNQMFVVCRRMWLKSEQCTLAPEVTTSHQSLTLNRYICFRAHNALTDTFSVTCGKRKHTKWRRSQSPMCRQPFAQANAHIYSHWLLLRCQILCIIFHRSRGLLPQLYLMIFQWQQQQQQLHRNCHRWFSSRRKSMDFSTSQTLTFKLVNPLFMWIWHLIQWIVLAVEFSPSRFHCGRE